MKQIIGQLICIMMLAAYPTAGWSDPQMLDIERRCGQCHDVGSHKSLVDEDWLARLTELGPIDELNIEQRAEVVSFLHYHGWEVNEVLGMAKERHLFEQKCGICHAVERVFVKAMSAEQIDATIARMRHRAPEWITEAEATTIAEFLHSGARGVRRPEHMVINGGPADVFRARCAGCHPLERAYLYLETELEPHWPLLVKRMQAKAPEWINDDEARQIVEYLSDLEPQLRTRVQGTTKK